MKQILFAAVLALSTVSFAQQSKVKTNVREFTVSSVPVNQGQVTGTIKVDYAASMMKVDLQLAPSCRAGQMCAQILRVFQAELPIKSVKNDTCNIHTVTALEDKRPVDGMLKKLVLTDVADMTCKTLMAVYPEATLDTAYVNRMDGKSVTETKKMVLSLEKAKATQVYPLVEYVASFGFSPDPGMLTLTVDTLGHVTSVRESYRTPTKPSVTMEVATLSAQALNNLKAQLMSIKEDNSLMDDRAGQPECVDAGNVDVSVLVDDVRVQIYRNSGCHTYRSTVWPATSVSELMLGLATLVK